MTNCGIGNSRTQPEKSFGLKESSFIFYLSFDHDAELLHKSCKEPAKQLPATNLPVTNCQ
jgi:hypothetical protein